MAKYEIKRWDPIVFGSSVHPFPVISIKPDKEFIEFANKNLNTLLIKIEGTNTIYEGKTMVGIMDSSAVSPVCTPVAFNKDKLYTIALYAKWYGYPDSDKLGRAVITGLKGKFKAPKVKVPPYKAPLPAFPMVELEHYEDSYGGSYEEPYCSDSLTTQQIGGVAIGLLVVFGVLFWISFSTKNNIQVK